MFNLEDFPKTEDGGFARMPTDDMLKPENVTNEVLLDSDLWFMPMLEEREQAVISQALHYQSMNTPGLPNHLYLVTIIKLIDMLSQVEVEFETDD